MDTHESSLYVSKWSFTRSIEKYEVRVRTSYCTWVRVSLAAWSVSSSLACGLESEFESRLRFGEWVRVSLAVWSVSSSLACGLEREFESRLRFGAWVRVSLAAWSVSSSLACGLERGFESRLWFNLPGFSTWHFLEHVGGGLPSVLQFPPSPSPHATSHPHPLP